MRKLLVLMLTIIMAISVSACGASKPSVTQVVSGENSTKLQKITIGTTAWPTNMFAYLAQEKGIFEKNGLEVKVEYFPSSSESSNAFVAGNLDFCTYASPDTIPPFSEGAEFQVVLMSDKSLGSDGLVSKSNITTVEALRGKTIATQLYSVDHMYLLTLLDQAGMTDKDVNIVDMTIADSSTAFIAGQVDAASVWEPYLSKAVAGGGKLLYSTKDDPDLITDCIAASKKIVENRSDTVQAFVNSWYEAVEYWENNKVESEKFMAEKLEVTPQEFSAMMDTLYITTAKDSVVGFTKAEDVAYWGYTQQKIAKFLMNLKVIDKEPKVENMINDKFVNTYIKNKK